MPAAQSTRTSLKLHQPFLRVARAPGYIERLFAGLWARALFCAYISARLLCAHVCAPMPLCLSPHVSGERVRRRAVWHPRGGGDARSRLRAAERGQRRARRRDGGALRPNAGASDTRAPAWTPLISTPKPLCGRTN
eukprot:5857905-Pleurochrysis_carterae.AAC.3